MDANVHLILVMKKLKQFKHSKVDKYLNNDIHCVDCASKLPFIFMKVAHLYGSKLNGAKKLITKTAAP